MTHRTKEDWSKLSVYIGDEVDSSRIADDAVIHPGCRISGESTSIGPGCEIGAEAPATIEDCQLGRGVKLKGGYFSNAVFFDGANMSSGAHVRAGCILEEEANGAHAVGLKQTILLPFVTLGSLINFCDALMAGGTSRKDHSEVGSSYIHFNYTPHQDKATASLIGDVPSGVFLDQKPIFLGGQGGLVGPARIAYGSVVAAGGVCRQDLLDEDQLLVPAVPAATTRPYDTGVYRSINRLVKNNLVYIGNIVALREWYRNVRSAFMTRDAFDKACFEGGMNNLDLVLAERIKRLGDLARKMDDSIERLGKLDKVAAEQRLLLDSWQEMEVELKQHEWDIDTESRDDFLAAVDKVSKDGSYTATIQSLNLKDKEAGRRWLQSIVDAVTALWPQDSI
jgi:UDP-N-acetylglucosamine/UDP-N-acetylgalactosamine diphosphorylase